MTFLSPTILIPIVVVAVTLAAGFGAVGIWLGVRILNQREELARKDWAKGMTVLITVLALLAPIVPWISMFLFRIVQAIVSS